MSTLKKVVDCTSKMDKFSKNHFFSNVPSFLQGFSGLPSYVELAFLRGRHIYFVKVAPCWIAEKPNHPFFVFAPGEQILDLLSSIEAPDLKANTSSKRWELKPRAKSVDWMFSELVGVTHGLTLPGNRTFLFSSDKYWRLLPGWAPVRKFRLPFLDLGIAGVSLLISTRGLVILAEPGTGGGAVVKDRTLWESWETETDRERGRWNWEIVWQRGSEAETMQMWSGNCELLVMPRNILPSFHSSFSSSFHQSKAFSPLSNDEAAIDVRRPQSNFKSPSDSLTPLLLHTPFKLSLWRNSSVAVCPVIYMSE